MTIFEIDYLNIEARGYSVERHGVISQHRTVFVRAESIEQAIEAVRQWHGEKHGPNFDFGEVWRIERSTTNDFIDATP